MGGRGAAARRAGTMKKIGFDNKKYLEMQSTHIRERIGQFGNKLYLEFGGKLFDDYHASRVLPGFAPDSKIRMLKELRDSAEIVIAISLRRFKTGTPARVDRRSIDFSKTQPQD